MAGFLLILSPVRFRLYIGLLAQVLAACVAVSAPDYGAVWQQNVWSLMNAKPLGGVQLVDADRDLQDALTRIGDTIRKQQFDEAVEGLQSLINADRPVLFPRWDDPRRYIPSSEVATRILGLLPDTVIGRASRQNEGAARRHYEDARRDLREDMLLRTGRQYFHTTSGGDALNTLAGLAFDRGAFLEAAYLWETLCIEQRLQRPDRPLILAKAVIAAHLGGWKSKAGDLFALLSGSYPDTKATIGGREQSVVGFVRQSLAGAAPQGSPAAVAAQWDSFAGAADGYAVMPDCTVSPLTLWKQAEGERAANIRSLLRISGGEGDPGLTRVDAAVADGRVNVTIRRPGEPAFSFNLPSTVHPLVLPDRVVCRREDGITAMASDTGRELWRAGYPMCRGDAPGRSVNHYLPLAGDVGRYAATAGDGMVFAVGRFRRLDPDAYSKFGATLEMDTSSLAAFSLADGRPVWEIGVGKGDVDVLKTAKFLTAPTYSRGRLYAIAKCGNRYQAICIEARTGRRLWDVPIGPIPTHTGEQMSWQAAYTMEIMTERVSPPSVANGVVYLLTNSGLVMALDAETGAPLWAYRYESKVSTTADIGRSFEVANMAFLMAASRSPFPPANPVLVVNGRVIVAPSDGGTVLALHALSGEKLWQTQKTGQRDLSAVDDTRVLLSGPDLMFIGVNDGGTIKKVEAGVEDRPAVTRTAVVAAGQGGLVRVELSDYSASSQPASDPQALLGRLVSVGGRLVAANGAGVSVYLGFDDAWETLTRRIKESSDPRQRMDWLLQRGALAFQAGRAVQAMAEFRAAAEAARALKPDDLQKAQSWLFKTLLRVADETGDESEAMRCIAEADGVAEGDGARDFVSLARMRACERFGKADQAAAIAQTISETTPGGWMTLPESGVETGGGLLTRYQWGQGQIDRLVHKHGQTVYAQFDAQMDAALERGRQGGDVESLLAAWRRWPHAARADEALYTAAAIVWQRGGVSPDASVAARVDRILGEIGTDSPLRGKARSAQQLVDSRVRPVRVSAAVAAGAGLATNAPISFGGYVGCVADVLENARQAARRVSVESASLAGVTGGLAYAWRVGGAGMAVLRTSDGAPVLPGERRLCIHDEQSVTCLDVQGSVGQPKAIWSIAVPRVADASARSGYYCADNDLLVLLTPEHLIAVEVGTGREVARKTTRDLGVFPWSRAMFDGARGILANDRNDWITCVSVPGLSREWSVRGNGFKADGMSVGCDMVMVPKPRRRPSATVLDIRTGRQVFAVDSQDYTTAMNPDGFCAVLGVEGGKVIEFRDPRRGDQSLVGRATVKDGMCDFVAFGERFAVLQDRATGSVLRLVDIAGQVASAEVRLTPEPQTNRVVAGTVLEANRLTVLSGLRAGGDGLLQDIAMVGVDLSSGVVAWRLEIAAGKTGPCRVRGLLKSGKVLSLLVVPNGDKVPARHLLIDGAEGRLIGDFAEPFGLPETMISRPPDWTGSPVVLNGRVVFETGTGLVCFAEQL